MGHPLDRDRVTLRAAILHWRCGSPLGPWHGDADSCSITLKAWASPWLWQGDQVWELQCYTEGVGHPLTGTGWLDLTAVMLHWRCGSPLGSWHGDCLTAAMLYWMCGSPVGSWQGDPIWQQQCYTEGVDHPTTVIGWLIGGSLVCIRGSLRGRRHGVEVVIWPAVWRWGGDGDGADAVTDPVAAWRRRRENEGVEAANNPLNVGRRGRGDVVVAVTITLAFWLWRGTRCPAVALCVWNQQ